MQLLFYKMLIWMSRRFGQPVFIIFSWFVASGYFFLFPRRLLVAVGFYRALFPENGRPYHIWCAWRQYHSFTRVFLDRFVFEDAEAEAVYSGNWKEVEKQARQRQPAP